MTCEHAVGKVKNIDQIEQRYLAWNPVPERANVAFELGVEALVSRLRGGLEEVFVVAFAPKPAPPGAGYVGLDYWRIRFVRVRAFRYRPITRWPMAAFARPADSDAGAWEVSPSRWMTEALPPILREDMHHYVITYNDDAYELIAAGWSSEPLPEGWRQELRAHVDGS